MKKLLFLGALALFGYLTLINTASKKNAFPACENIWI